MKNICIIVACMLFFDLSAQNSTHLSVLFKIDSVNVTNKIDRIIIITNDSIRKKVVMIKSKSNIFDFRNITFDNNTFLFIEHKKKLYFLTETFMFKMKGEKKFEMDTLFVESQYFSKPTEIVLWNCRRLNEKVQGDFYLSFKNEHLGYSYPIFNHKKYFRKNKKFLKYTLKGKDFEFKMKQCR
ncbi:MAG: hypothetical protein RBS19_08370 [Bacteroidales bacterium]|nr:hypothetical protein [Bacteroidales bacterium]